MTVVWVDFCLTLLNSIFCFGVFVWIARLYIVPSVRYDLQLREHSMVTTSEDITQSVHELARVEKEYATQEREVARLTVCIEQWVGILAQRAALAEEEQSALLLRYKDRCNENEQVRVREKAKRFISEQVLKNARTELRDYYMQPGKKEHYMDALCHHIFDEKNDHD